MGDCITETAGVTSRDDIGRGSMAAGGPQAPARAAEYSLPLLLAVLTAIALFRIAALAFNATDLYVDEAQYWSWSKELDFGYYSKPPLLAWIIAAVTPLCGDGEACVRLPSVFFHLATSVAVYFIGRGLYSAETGFWSAIAYATLPGISVSSGIISTDVPLLLAWAVALLAFAELVTAPSLAMAALLGLALGLGLNAKYAMAYFVPCAAIFFLMAPDRRALLRRPHLWLAAAIAALLITPNILWNAANGFATLAHTADNANWSGSLFNPGKALEFVASQFGVFGPVMFGALLVIVARVLAGRKNGPTSQWSSEDKLLAAFSVPIIVALTVQGLLSRSLANWAAPAYIAATVLVVATMLERGDRGWLKASLAVNAALAVAIAVGTWQAGRFVLPGGSDPYARTLGNHELASVVGARLSDPVTPEGAYGSLLTDDRDNLAALLYYGRDFAVPLFAWRADGAPRNHFELMRPFRSGAPEPVLLVSRRADGSSIPASFRNVRSLGAVAVPAGRHSERKVYVFTLSGFRG